MLPYSFQDLKKKLKTDVSALPKVKVALLGDTATQFLSMAIRGMGIERGYSISLTEFDYNQVEQQVLDKNSEFYSTIFDYVIIFQSTHKLLERYSTVSVEEQKQLASTRLDFIHTLCESVTGRIIYYNYPEIEDGIFGSYGNKVISSFIYQVRKLNFELMNIAREYADFYICDLAGIQNKMGRDTLFDSSIYTSTEMILSLNSLPYIASRTMDIICAIEGKFNKCLILDLDNTLWGGVVGDDGWENIQVGHGLGIGQAFTEFQEWIKKLKNRGIIVAVCSKNDEVKAKEPFLKNPEMILKLEDIAVFIANWESKVDNIKTIQQILNIGFDSMVFLDDNPFERNLVREHLPLICVPELPEDPSAYLEYLYSLNLFETASYNEEDKNRTSQYQIEAQRISLKKSFTNETDFLKSLDMISEVKGFDSFNIPRVAQLSQRSNQFNLRTKRYTEAQLHDMAQNKNFIPFTFTLQDKFGDNGLICVVILEKIDTETVFVDTWFMSCRVLKRGMEYFVLNTIVEWARSHDIKNIVGEYLPTAKNSLVANHYSQLGFIPMKEGTTQQYILNTTNYKTKKCYIAGKK